MSPSTIRFDIAAVAAAILLTLATGADAASRGPAGHGGAPTTITRNPSAPALRYGWGYGRGWCYWHPYACYRY